MADSWQRSLERGADPRGGPPVELTDADLAEYRDAHPLAAAMPVVRRLLVEDAAEAGLIVALTDASGQLLWVEGSAGSRRRAEGIGFVEGATWSEEAAGTNAPGTALALDHAVQIFGAEHLAGPVTEWSCSAAPIHAPDGSLLGAVDLTGGDDAAAPAQPHPGPLGRRGDRGRAAAAATAHRDGSPGRPERRPAARHPLLDRDPGDDRPPAAATRPAHR